MPNLSLYERVENRYHTALNGRLPKPFRRLGIWGEKLREHKLGVVPAFFKYVPPFLVTAVLGDAIPGFVVAALSYEVCKGVRSANLRRRLEIETKAHNDTQETNHQLEARLKQLSLRQQQLTQEAEQLLKNQEAQEATLEQMQQAQRSLALHYRRALADARQGSLAGVTYDIIPDPQEFINNPQPITETILADYGLSEIGQTLINEVAQNFLQLVGGKRTYLVGSAGRGTFLFDDLELDIANADSTYGSDSLAASVLQRIEDNFPDLSAFTNHFYGTTNHSSRAWKKNGYFCPVVRVSLHLDSAKLVSRKRPHIVDVLILPNERHNNLDSIHFLQNWTRELERGRSLDQQETMRRNIRMARNIFRGLNADVQSMILDVVMLQAGSFDHLLEILAKEPPDSYRIDLRKHFSFSMVMHTKKTNYYIGNARAVIAFARRYVAAKKSRVAH